MKNAYVEKAQRYCSNHNLSVDKLKEQKTFLIYDDFIFAQPVTPSYSDGLKTDLASQPKPTLIYHIDTGEIEETEYTDKYLK